MATGTGKTLTAAAVMKLFLGLPTDVVPFLVDRLNLEDQAHRAFAALPSADFQTPFIAETGTTGAVRRSSSPPCSRLLFTTTNTRSSSRRPTSIS